MNVELQRTRSAQLFADAVDCISTVCVDEQAAGMLAFPYLCQRGVDDRQLCAVACVGGAFSVRQHMHTQGARSCWMMHAAPHEWLGRLLPSVYTKVCPTCFLPSMVLVCMQGHVMLSITALAPGVSCQQPSLPPASAGPWVCSAARWGGLPWGCPTSQSPCPTPASLLHCR
jgi:hypothetical protein